MRAVARVDARQRRSAAVTAPAVPIPGRVAACAGDKAVVATPRRIGRRRERGARGRSYRRGDADAGAPARARAAHAAARLRPAPWPRRWSSRRPRRRGSSRRGGRCSVHPTCRSPALPRRRRAAARRPDVAIAARRAGTGDAAPDGGAERVSAGRRYRGSRRRLRRRLGATHQPRRRARATPTRRRRLDRPAPTLADDAGDVDDDRHRPRRTWPRWRREEGAGAPRAQAHSRTAEPTPVAFRRSPAIPARTRPAMPFPAPARVARSSEATVAAARPCARAWAPCALRRRCAGAPARAGRPTARRFHGRWPGARRPRLTLVEGSGERGALLPLSPQLRPTRRRPRRAHRSPAFRPSSTSTRARRVAGRHAEPPAIGACAAHRRAAADRARRRRQAGAVGRQRAATNASTASTASPPPPPTAAPIDYAARASELMANQMPRLAQRAERLVARVLFVAGRSEHVAGDDQIRAAAATVGRDGSRRARRPVGLGARSAAPRRRRARRVRAARRHAGSAGAAGARVRRRSARRRNRRQPRIPAPASAAGTARSGAPARDARAQLHGARYPEGRIEDWATFAIASALAGRERDSRNAFLVTLALAPNLGRHCRAALDVYAIYGERLRAPIEAMLYSANASGRATARRSANGRRTGCERRDALTPAATLIEPRGAVAGERRVR